MPFIIFFLIWYNVYGKNNPKIYRTIHNGFGKLVGAIIFLSVISSVGSSLAYSLGFLLGLALFFGVPFAIVVSIIKAITGAGKKKADITVKSKVVKDKKLYGTGHIGLTRSVPKRRKIVIKFNKKYKLNLTEDEINRIVDASYMSVGWEREIADMDKDMDSIYEWYTSDTSWLRAYLRVFPVQTVSSDFERQHQICLDVFDQIFREINPASYPSMDMCIEAINNRYLTFFDETSFMIAYRFLQANGRKYELPRAGLVNTESELDRLMSKYDEAIKNGSLDREKMLMR